MIDNDEANEGMRPLGEAPPSMSAGGLGSQGSGTAPESDSVEVDPFELTDQEQAILAALAAGADRMAVAEALGMPVASVDSSVVGALHKLHRLSRQLEDGAQ